MQEKMEMVEAMAELREYTATLEARLKMQTIHTTQPTATCCPPVAHPQHVRPQTAYPVHPGWSPVGSGPYPSLPYPTPRVSLGIPQPYPHSSKGTPPLPPNTSYVIPRVPPITAPKSNQKPKSNSKPSTKISVPDGGTIIIGGVRRLPLPKSNSAPLPIKGKLLPQTSVSKVQAAQQNVVNLELRVAQLQAELQQLKSQQQEAKSAPQKLVPQKLAPIKNKNEWRSKPSKEKKETPDEKTFSFFIGTSR